MNDQTATVEITEDAAKRITHLLSSEPEGSRLRIAVDGGGCSGFQYQFEFVTEQAEDDLVIEQGGATVLIDPMSLEFMGDAVVDYVETLGAAHFEVRNPQATATCGCGNSFAV